MRGADRAMLYQMAGWTGFRRQELASITLASLDLDGPTPVVRVKATSSKRKRNDAVPLHPYLVARLRAWLARRKSPIPTAPLFALRSVGGGLRQTSKMMRADLAAARRVWIEEAEDDADRHERQTSDFLNYCNGDGLYADFHANRHTFISNLGRAGVPLAIAQKLARHSDPRLTASRYTHLELEDLGQAIGTLPTPPRRPTRGLRTECFGGGAGFGCRPGCSRSWRSLAICDAGRRGARRRSQKTESP